MPELQHSKKPDAQACLQLFCKEYLWIVGNFDLQGRINGFFNELNLDYQVGLSGLSSTGIFQEASERLNIDEKWVGSIVHEL